MPIMYVCPQVGDYAANKHALHELQHEATMYKHLRGEQGVSVGFYDVFHSYRAAWPLACLPSSS